MSSERDDKLSSPLIGSAREYRGSERRDKLLLGVAVALIVIPITLYLLWVALSSLWLLLWGPW